MSSPASSRQGNRFGMVSIAIAIVVTLLVLPHLGLELSLDRGGAAIGGISFTVARRIEMSTAMPQLVAAFHSLVGLAAVFVAVGAFMSPADFGITDPDGHSTCSRASRWAAPAAIIGAITFSGSVIAFGKLQAKLPPSVEGAWAAPARGQGRHELAADHAAGPARHQRRHGCRHRAAARAGFIAAESSFAFT
ncbi:MAG: NAD(P)(+) transhydrogenase (Re/Si-specific) subunit beta [Geminicoccaceae bacterium]